MSSDAISDDNSALLLRAAAVADLLEGLLERCLSGSSLSPREFEIATVLSVRGPQSPSELAGVTGVPAPSVSRVTGRLERAGLLRQQAHASDRRSRLFELTPNGRAAFAAAQAEFRKLYLKVAETLGPGLPVAAFGLRRLEWALRVVSGEFVPDALTVPEGPRTLPYRGRALTAFEEAEVLDYIEWVRSRRSPLMPAGASNVTGVTSGRPA